MFRRLQNGSVETPASWDRLPEPLAVALQGGGAHGAFTWGVLDRLLEDEGFTPSAMSGASAGAINAAVVAWGWLEGGREAAREALAKLWNAVGQVSLLNPLRLPGAGLQFDLMTRLVSPYQFNPLNLNPLRDILHGMIDFDRLRRDGEIQLFLSATDVSTGDQRIFREDEVSLEVLMASSCIPYVHQAVEIEGHSYWDGGFSSNPPLLPMVLESDCQSVLLVKLTPDVEPGPPTNAPDIFGRLKRILFNAPLLREIDALAEMQRLLSRTHLVPADLRRLRDLSVETLTIDHGFFHGQPGAALDPHPDMLWRLHQAGRLAADALLSEPAIAEPLRAPGAR